MTDVMFMAQRPIFPTVRWLLLYIIPLAFSQTLDQSVVRQGETLRARADVGIQMARLDGRTIRLFPAPEGGFLGLMPIPVEQKPGSYRLEFLDAAGTVKRAVPVTVADAQYPIQNIVISKEIAGLSLSPDEAETSRAFRKTVSETRAWKEPFELPVTGCLTSAFGVRRFQNGKPTGDFHGGLDLGSPAGTPVHAMADGVVRIVKSWNLHGNTVGIDHGQGVLTMYLHLSKFATTEGAAIKQGDVIGYVGSTGRSTGPHLHWSLYVNSEPVDPGQWVNVPAACKAAPARAHNRRT
jgi:murein DD-endopeptidase MepM/ murein hydrolase activator NlpD